MMFLNAQKEAFSQIGVERWELFKKLFNREELIEIADNNKIVTQYIIMQEVQKKVHQRLIDNYSGWKSEYKEACHLIDNLLGFKDKEKTLTDILNTKIEGNE